MSDKETPRQTKHDAGADLPLRRREFVRAYTDKTAPTFGNGLQSVRASHPTLRDKPASAGVQAVRVLKDDKVHAYMQQLLDETNVGTRVQLAALGSVIRGEYRQETYGLDAEGAEVVTSARTPSGAEIAKCVDVLARITGHYQRLRVQADVLQDRYRELARQFKPATMRKVGPKRRARDKAVDDAQDAEACSVEAGAQDAGQTYMVAGMMVPVEGM